LPKLEERKLIILKYLEEVIKIKGVKTDRSLVVSEEINDTFIEEMGTMTEGFSGRELFKLVNAFND